LRRRGRLTAAHPAVIERSIVENFIYHSIQWLGGVNNHAIAWDILFCFIEPENEVYCTLPLPPLIALPGGEPMFNRMVIYVHDEHRIEHSDTFFEVS
jgi:hypothetical protein